LSSVEWIQAQISRLPVKIRITENRDITPAQAISSKKGIFIYYKSTLPG